MSFERNQLVASGGGKVRVESKHLYPESDLIDCTLAGRLRRTPQLKVLKAIIGALSVQMVRKFTVSQNSTYGLFHDQPVFKNFAPLDAVDVGKAKADVALSSDVPLHLAGLGRTAALVFGDFVGAAALAAAKFLLSVERATRSALDGHRLVALDANDIPLRVVQVSPLPAAFGRAVQWIAAKLLPVAPKLSGSANERVAAHFASERHARDVLRAAIMRVVALARAEFAGRSAVAGHEQLLAMKAFFHFHLPREFGLFYQNQTHWSIAQGAA